MEEQKHSLPLCGKEGCRKPSKLQCPTCKKLGLPPSYFCSQDCFKAEWPKHKTLHDVGPLDIPDYKFTGPLRPWTTTGRRPVPEKIRKPDYATDGIPHSEILYETHKKGIHVNTPEEIAGIKEACKLARKILDGAHKAVAPGVTTEEIDRVVHELTIENDAYPSPLNYYNFPKSVCTSVNEVVCHGIPDLRPLKEGDIVNVDVTTYLRGFHGDISETYMVGQQSESSLQLVKTTYESMWKAIEICKPGVPFHRIGASIEKHASEKGLSVVRDYAGHGVGKLFHCEPVIPHYAAGQVHGTMKPGHVFTIEPMLNQGCYDVKVWPDKWTVVSADGQRSAQFEHTILITEDGCEVLTRRFEDSPPLGFQNRSNIHGLAH